MGKPIVLTWKNDYGYIVIEKCELVSEDDQVRTFVDHPLNSDGSINVPNVVQTLAQQGKVIFEDEHGMFCLTPDKVLLIQHLEEIDDG